MKYLILLSMIIMALGLRIKHTNKYDLGYQAGVQDVMEAMVKESEEFWINTANMMCG